MANVYTTVSNAIWYTDKCEIVTGADPVTYNVYVISTTPPRTVGGDIASGEVTLYTTAAQDVMANATVVGANIPANTTVNTVSVGVSLDLTDSATGNVVNGVFTITLPDPGNLYSNSVQVAANNRQQVYVGAGNYLTIDGGNFTARELGTASSAQAGVIGQG